MSAFIGAGIIDPITNRSSPNEFQKFDTNVHNTEGAALVAGLAISVATRNELAVLNPTLHTHALLTESERVGLFEWKEGNFIALVSLDNEQGVYVAPSSAPTGASGVWKRHLIGNMLRPEWFGAVGDYDPATNTGHDDTAGIQAALDFASLTGVLTVTGGPTSVVVLAPKNYLTSNIRLRWLVTVIGEGDRQVTAVWAKDGTTGVFWGVPDSESPQKIILRQFSLYGRGLAGISHGLKLSSSAPAAGSGQAGTEGGLYDLWIRDFYEGTALEVDGNVYYMDRITIETCKFGLNQPGTSNMIGMISFMQIGQNALTPWVDPARTVSGIPYVLKIVSSTLQDVHIEAPVSGIRPIIFTRGESFISALKISPSAGTSLPAILYTDSVSFRRFKINFFNILNPNNITITEAVVKHGNPDTETWTNALGTDVEVLNNGEVLNWRRIAEDRRSAAS